jgi:hypothetical protein
MWFDYKINSRWHLIFKYWDNDILVQSRFHGLTFQNHNSDYGLHGFNNFFLKKNITFNWWYNNKPKMDFSLNGYLFKISVTL